MYNVTKIQDSLNGVVGYRQPLNPDYPTLTAANLASRSGRFVTDNPYCKIEFIYDNEDYRQLSESQFNDSLQLFQKSSISEVIGWVFNKPDFIDRQVLLANANNKVDTVTLPAGLVCYKIEVDRTKNIAFEISRVFLDFEGSGTVRILLFNSAKKDPIFTKDVVITSAHQIEVLNWKLDNSDDTYKGEFYLGYLSNDIDLDTLKPYKRDYNNSDVMSVITHLNIQRIVFDGVTLEELPDLESDDGLSDNIGINPDITVYEDYTDLIIQNEVLFSRAIALQLTIKCISTYLAALRSNRNERKGEQNIVRITQEIEGQNSDGTVKITGLRPQLTTEIAKIKSEIDKIRDGYFTSEITVHTLE